MRRRFAATLAAVAAATTTALLFGAGSAGAASYSAYCPGDSGYLQTLINGAGSGDTITIYGTCYGNYTVSGKSNLTLQGGSAGATLNGKGLGTTLAIDSSTVTIRNLTITNGNASGGGGLFITSSRVSMTNSTVVGNRAFQGGGIWAGSFSTVDLTGVTVTKNEALYQGGGIAVDLADLTITASTISRNKTTGVAEQYGGGGIWIRDANALLTNTRVTANSSSDYGGGIAFYGTCGPLVGAPIGEERICETQAGTASGKGAGSVVLDGLTLVSSSVDHNIAADDGGGMYVESGDGDAPVSLDGTTVSFNTAVSGDGGGIASYGECGFTASVLATKSTLQGNTARNGEGGAVYNSAGIDGCGSAGTALVTLSGTPVANGSTIVNSNQARYGGGIANDQIDGIASVALQPGATVKGNKASVTGGGVWNNCGSFSSQASILLNTPNNVVNVCLPPA